jgi:hypothetical protein
VDAAMIKAPPPKSRGIAGPLLLFCVAGGAAGFGFDVFGDMGARFGVAAQPGARAVLGLGVAAILVLAAHAMRWALGRAPHEEKGETRARDHA